MIPNNSHSEIIDYPINYELYPKMKNVKFMEFILNENEFLLIPNRWLHMVVTEPFTFALSFELSKMKTDESSILHEKFKNQVPYKSRGKNTNFDFKTFISDNKDTQFVVLFSENYDLSPVIKNDTIKYLKQTTLEEAYLEAKDKKYYAYIGQQSDLKYNNIEFISKYINNVQESDIDYETKLWLNLHKTVNSGLHRDPNSKIMYVLKGQKKVYLLPPHNSEDAYIKVFNTVNKISNNNEYNTKSNTLEKKIIKFYSL